LEWPKKLKPLVDAETEEEEEGGGYRKHDTPTSVNIIVRVSTVPENAKQLLRVAVVLKYTKIR
jgi:hypothetical protein